LIECLPYYLKHIFILRSDALTIDVSESAKPLVVVIAIPVEKFIPAGKEQLAADRGGITIEK